MEPRDRCIAALNRQSLDGFVPHFELAFFLTMEAFGKVHPRHRDYSQWRQMEEKERQLHREDQAKIFISIAEEFNHCAIMLNPKIDVAEEIIHLVDIIRDRTGNRYFIMTHGDATFGIPDGNQLTEFVYRLVDEPQKVKQEAQEMVDKALHRAEQLYKHGGLDGFLLATDYCFNQGSFLNPNQFSEFVTPYLAKLIRGYRDMGFYTIEHTDGNIMPIIDQLIQANPHALHSLDPQGGIDIKDIKDMYGNLVCLIGNVNCGLLDTGSDTEVVESARYALRHGMPGGGYIFSSSNCIYTGMRLERYNLMLKVWREEGIYP